MYSKNIPQKYGIVGKSNKIKEIFKKVSRLGENDATVLITGSTGSGKELVAQAIHNVSARKNHRFIAVNCGSIPSELFESELFGHERGAFTSASEAKPGKFELANRGTIFLDEIGNLPLSLQAKLLRVLQEREIERIGATQSIPTDFRVIAATNIDLEKAVLKGIFREDLYHRLNVVPLILPSLRERQQDIEPLTYFFLDYFGKKYNNPFTAIEAEALRTLQNYAWTGNVRELKHLLEQIVALENGPILKQAYLPIKFHMKNLRPIKHSNFKEMLEGFAKDVITEALDQFDGNRSRTARFLGLKRTTLITKIKQYGLEAA